MEKTHNEDPLIWSRFRNGDQDAFAELYKRHSIALIAYGLKLCPDRHILKDQIQELFVELWNSHSQLAPTDSVKFYLFKALRYKLIRLEKKRQAFRPLRSQDEDLPPEVMEEQPIETVIVEREMKALTLQFLSRAIRELPLRQQEVIQLRFYQGFSHEEIAELMHMNYQSVSNLIYRALSRLKTAIKSPAHVSALISVILLIMGSLYSGLGIHSV